MLRILCIDIEGGYGGSSRSLYYSVKNILENNKDVYIEVWSKKSGPIQDLYSNIGVVNRVFSSIPKITPVSLFSRNIYLYIIFSINWIRSYRFRSQTINEINSNFDLLHCNHESLFLFARWLKNRVNVPITTHIRTIRPVNMFSNWQKKIIGATMSKIVFITENEMKPYELFIGKNKSIVIHNIAEEFNSNIKGHELIPEDTKLKIACISNYSWNRGTDRLIEIAKELKTRNNKNILFVVAGSMNLTKSMPGVLGKLAHEGKNLRDYAVDNDVADYFIFLGHVSEPERVIKSCDALIKLTRWDATWGRDIIESLINKVPVYTIGEYDKFVKNNITGILLKKYNLKLLTDIIETHESQRYILRDLGYNAKKLATNLCDGRGNGFKLLSVWRDSIDS